MKHFSISEMLRSDTAIRRCLWNGANLEAEENLRALVDEVLDPLWECYGKLAHLIEAAGKFDQLIYEKNSPAGPQWLHVSWRRNGINRKRVLHM